MPTTPAQLTAAQSAAVVIKQSLNAVDVTTLTQADISLLLGDATTLLADVQAFTPAVIPSGALYSVFNNPLSPAQFQALTGQPTTIGMAFATVNQPSDIANIGKTLVRYLGGQSLANIIAPVNICTGAASKNSPGLAACAGGAYDAYFTQTGKDLVSGGFPNAVIRLAWEMNGGWFPWAANGGSGGPQGNYIPAIQQVVSTLRAVPGNRFTFMSFNPTYGDQGVGNLALYYPGDSFCDWVALDAYDTSPPPGLTGSANWNRIRNGPYGLTWLKAFAQAHSKGIAIPEWGLWSAANNSPNTWPCGGSDDPVYIENMLAWVKANNVLSSYWNQALPLSAAPQSLAAYKAAF